MATRISEFQRNVWGSQAERGVDAQRADLWIVDMSTVTEGLKTHFRFDDYNIEPYYAKSVSLPELKVKAEMVRRDSRAYMVPGFDEPLDPIKIVFLMDASIGNEEDQKLALTASKVYRFLDSWRSLVRAGRGGFSQEREVEVNAETYRIDYAFNVTLYLLRGTALKTQKASVPSLLPPFVNTHKVVVDQGLEMSQYFTLVNAWLAGFKMSDFNYDSGTTLATIDATLYAEDIKRGPVRKDWLEMQNVG